MPLLVEPADDLEDSPIALVSWAAEHRRDLDEWLRRDGAVAAARFRYRQPGRVPRRGRGNPAQQYNRRKKRKGAFWEDRYHATAVQSGEHLARCLIYIDLNMLRAGAVRHPAEWADGGYREVFESRQRYRTIDVWALAELLGFNRLAEMKCAYKQWLLAALEAGHQQREEAWTESLAVGSREFVENFKAHLGTRVRTRQIEEQIERCLLKESPATYSCQIEAEIGLLSAKIGVKSHESYGHSMT